MNDPWPKIREWLGGAWSQKDGVPDMALATATNDGAPSVRMVSLRGLDDRGLRFFTHDGSRKTLELAANPRAAVVLHFAGTHRQLRVEGDVERLPREAAARYFAGRPRGAQLSATVSRQDRPSPGIAALRRELQRVDAELGDAAVPCPDDFIGYRIVPRVVELWEGSDDRMHDRVQHRLVDGVWQCAALQP
ncbi:MAG TPA: pyridoxal 5'-phosphate synthase [Nannocystaceae bacterium]|nr:pyridoxal 5'-phosphate synthase [Nannocystaceae bacterium]